MRTKRPTPGQAAGRPLRPESLARDFGPKAKLARRGVRSLYESFLGAEHARALSSLDRWRDAFGKTCAAGTDRSSAKISALASDYGLAAADGSKPAEALFVLHTYYALLVKLLVWQVMAAVHKVPGPAERFLRAGSGNRLRGELEQFESGDALGELNVVGLFQEDLFSWYSAAWSEAVGQFVREAASRLAGYTPPTPGSRPGDTCDPLGTLYQELFPRPLRHALGEYYTPGWLVSFILDEVGWSGRSERRLLDPACGSGLFLVMAINRMRALHEAGSAACGRDKGELCGKILRCVVGCDLNPLAVMAAKANYLIAISDLVCEVDRVEIPVHLRDTILDEGESGGQEVGRFDCVVGNPPWIAWDNLPNDYRRATKALWERYGLFSLSASDARGGGGKKDLSMLMLYASADRYLNSAGRLGFVITQTLFQTKGAGDGFRRFRLGSGGAWLKVLAVNDMVRLRPFPQAANWTATILLEKGRRTTYPVPYVKWSAAGRDPTGSDDPRQNCRRRRYNARPIHPDRPNSPWLLLPEGLNSDISRLVGSSDYRGYLGANSGGANGVYWVRLLGERDGGVLVSNLADKGKRSAAMTRQVIEPDLLHPLVRWADVTRYRARPAAHILLVQDVQTRKGIKLAEMQDKYPMTYAYLRRFEGLLSARAAYKRYQSRAAFYSMYNVGPYTLAPIKVVWRRMDRRINAAVVRPVDDRTLGVRPVIPQETCVLVPADSIAEADYICAVLNSSVVHFLVSSHSVRGGKGFGTPSMLDYLKLRRFDPQHALHAELSSRGRDARRAAARNEDFSQIQLRIDRTAAQLWGIEQEELRTIESESE